MTPAALRLLGGGLLALGGALLGREKRLELTCRARCLRGLAAALGRAEGELETLRSPLEEIFAHVSDVPFFALLSAGFGREPLERLWRRAAAAQELAEGEREALAALGAVLGRCGAERQCAEIGLVRRRLSDAAAALERELALRGRRYDGLGAALGAIVAAVLF